MGGCSLQLAQMLLQLLWSSRGRVATSLGYRLMQMGSQQLQKQQPLLKFPGQCQESTFLRQAGQQLTGPGQTLLLMQVGLILGLDDRGK